MGGIGFGRRLLALLAVLFTMPAAAQEVGETIVQRGSVSADLYLAGRAVEVQAEVEGDVTVAGAQLGIGGTVTQDVIAAGRQVSITGQVGDDLRAAGQTVILSGAIADHMVAAGETVSLGAGSSVGSFAWLAGREVRVLGRVGGELRAAAETVIVGGQVRGDAVLAGEHLRVLADAHIGGDLIYHSPEEPRIEEGARIDGSIVAKPLPELEPKAGDWLFGALVFVLSLALVALAYYFLVPRFSVAAARAARQSALKSLGVGLGLLLVTPIAIVLLVASLVGWLAALVLLAAYLVWLVLGFVTGVHLVADAGLGLRGKAETAGRGARAVAIVIALVVVVLIGAIPGLGGLVVFVLLLLGLGGFALALGRAYRAPTA